MHRQVGRGASPRGLRRPHVYHLKSVDDFTGQYTALAAGAAVAGGGAVGTMKNANGVSMNLKATTRGVKLTAGVDGIKVSVEK